MPDHEILPAAIDSLTGHVGSYRRVLPVSLDRMFENTLDWEHLPHVHASTFKTISCQASGAWGWRAEVVDAKDVRSVIELRLDRQCRRWITRTLEGPNQGSEIWTHVFPIAADRVDILVDFFVPGVAQADRDKVGEAYANIYSRLYDEDVRMMVQRQRALNQRVGGGAKRVGLGPRSELTLPLTTLVGGRQVILREVEGDLLAHPVLCPHQLGPLQDAVLDGGVLTCPWHGYQFNVRSGDCVSGQSCRLPVISVSEQQGQIILALA